MITIIRLRSQEHIESIYDDILSRKDEFQDRIKGKGCLLYLSKRTAHDDVSLFIHTLDSDVLGDFIIDSVSEMEHITGAWIINMIKPRFYPLAKDTKTKKRYSITLKVFPKKIKDVYQAIADSIPPEGLKMAYIAYTCHLFGDCIQFSILADNEEVLSRYLEHEVEGVPGVLKITATLIEKTKPLVSYEEWKKYSQEHRIVVAWDDDSMIYQFLQ